MIKEKYVGMNQWIRKRGIFFFHFHDLHPPTYIYTRTNTYTHVQIHIHGKYTLKRYGGEDNEWNTRNILINKWIITKN